MRKTIAAAGLAAVLLIPASAADDFVAASAKEVRPLLIGATAPSAGLTNAAGEAVDLGELFSKQPTILIFYRGGW